MDRQRHTKTRARSARRHARTRCHPCVPVALCSIVSYTDLASTVHPDILVSMLDDIYSQFDKLTAAHGVYKVRAGTATRGPPAALTARLCSTSPRAACVLSVTRAG